MNIDLESRLAKEKAFHDDRYGSIVETAPKHYRANPTYHIYERMRDMLGDLRGRRILEYGCGEGWITKDLASRGALVDAFDISDQGVLKTKSALEKANLLEGCSVRQMAAEKLEFRPEQFDLSIGFAILHHLDISRSLAELHRVLKPGGVAVFAEPLGTNPLINLYRRLTPQYRTEDEAPINLNELEKQLGAFSSYSHHEYYLTALASLALLYVPLLNRAFGPINRALTSLDTWLIPRSGPFRRLSWYTIIVLRK